jgi:hypothetical protein
VKRASAFSWGLIGYEVISPVANFHYSTSYLFTNGPFQNAGVKANYAISDKVGIMVGALMMLGILIKQIQLKV